MTIKHLGGVFGRNPTFNDVTVDGGIYIGGETSSNRLSSYEEGTWTPTGFTAGSTSIVPGGSTSTSGEFTKIGNIVFGSFEINLNTSSTSPAVGDLFYYSGGLPYQPVEDFLTACGDLAVYGSVGSNILAVGHILIGSSRAQYYKITQISGSVSYANVIRGRFSYRV